MRRRRGRLRTGAYPAARGRTRRGPGPACVMRAQRDAVRLTSRRASPARRNPPALDSREPTWRNASPGDITKTTPPGGGGTRGRRAGSRAAPGSPEEGRAGDGATGTTADDRVRTRPAPGGDPPVGAVRDPDDGARAGSVSGADGPWTKRTATGAEPRTRSHCAPPAPSNPPFSAGSVDARGSTGSADGPELARGRAPRWSGRPGRRRSRAHAPGDFGSGRGGISHRARRRGCRLRAGRIQQRAHR